MTTATWSPLKAALGQTRAITPGCPPLILKVERKGGASHFKAPLTWQHGRHNWPWKQQIDSRSQAFGQRVAGTVFASSTLSPPAPPSPAPSGPLPCPIPLSVQVPSAFEAPAHRVHLTFAERLQAVRWPLAFRVLAPQSRCERPARLG